MANVDLGGTAKLIHREQNKNEEVVLDKRIDKVAFRMATIIFSFVPATFAALIMCISYNKIVSTFGFFEQLIVEGFIPTRLSYFAALGVCWTIVSLRLLFIKGE